MLNNEIKIKKIKKKSEEKKEVISVNNIMWGELH